MKHGLVFLALGAGIAFGCSKEPEPQAPPQGYYQQAPPPQQQQPYPQAQPAPAPAPMATDTAPPATTTAPATSASGGTPTAIPGVTKNADGTCSLTVPGGQPMNGPCPPGI